MLFVFLSTQLCSSIKPQNGPSSTLVPVLYYYDAWLDIWPQALIRSHCSGRVWVTLEATAPLGTRARAVAWNLICWRDFGPVLSCWVLMLWPDYNGATACISTLCFVIRFPFAERHFQFILVVHYTHLGIIQRHNKHWRATQLQLLHECVGLYIVYPLWVH